MPANELVSDEFLKECEIDESVEVIIGDLGLAWLVPDEMMTTMCGTPAFIAP